MQNVSPLRIGEKMPSYTISVFHQGAHTTLSTDSFRGKWLILFFYPADFTFVCPTELVQLASMYDIFHKENAEIISVSTDPLESHEKWHKDSPEIAKIQFPMAADEQGELCRMMGTYLPADNLSLRGTFIIDPDGTLMSLEINDNAVGRSGRELLRKLRALKFVREHAGMNVCQADWEPGDTALTLPQTAA